MRGKDGTDRRLGRLLARWVERVELMAPWLLLLSLSATALLFLYTMGNLGVTTDTAGMISERLDWRQRYLAYKESFPQYFEEVVIVIDGDTVDLAEDARDRLAERLKGEDTIRTVYSPGSEPFFRTNGLLYMTTEELQDLSDELARVQPLMGRLLDDTTIVGLASVLIDAMEEADDGEVELAPVFLDLAPAFPAAASGRFHRLSWRGLVNGADGGGDDRRRFVIVQPDVDFSGIQGEKAMKLIRSAAAELALDPAHGVRVRLTGSVAIANEELRTVSRGMGIATVVALALVVMILYAALRSPWLVISAVYTLLAGLVATAAFAAFAIGTLNLISVAFAVLYIGLGIDYAIHFCLRYRELVDGGTPHREAIKATAGDVGSSLVTCAATTSAAFFAFVPTAYSGVSELGVIAGAGMLISLGANLTLLPAMLYIFPLSPSSGREGSPSGEATGTDRLRDAPLRHRWIVWAVVGAATAASLLLLPGTGFEYNPMKLRPQKGEAVATFNELLAGDDPPLTVTAVKDTPEEALATKARLKGLDTVDKVVTIFDFIPESQDEKLAIIEDMALLMGPDLAGGRTGGTSPDHTLDDRLAALERLEISLSEFSDTGPDENSLAAGVLAVNVGDFLEAVDGSSADEAGEMVGRLEESLLAGLPGLAEDLSMLLNADYVAFDDLPAGLAERWVSPSGGFRVEVFPAVDIRDDDAMKRFVDDVRSVEPEATGPVVFMVEAGRSVIDAFTEAFIYALILICVILFVILRQARSVGLVLVPMLLAGLYTAAATVVLHVPFNFANTIALPLILGLGVDNGVHMVHRARAGKAGAKWDGGGSIMATSTVRAIFYSVLTTTAGFGGLAFSPHPGTASIGVLLAVGVLLNLFCTLVLLPTLLVGNK